MYIIALITVGIIALDILKDMLDEVLNDDARYSNNMRLEIYRIRAEEKKQAFDKKRQTLMRSAFQVPEWKGPKSNFN